MEVMRTTLGVKPCADVLSQRRWR